MDGQGNLYVCRYGKGAIAVFNPARTLLGVKRRSNFVLGDRDQKMVFVTFQDRKCMGRFRVEQLTELLLLKTRKMITAIGVNTP